MWGGHQQQGRRPGTEPVALAVGLAAALTAAHEEMDAHRTTVLRLRERFLTHLRQEAGPIVVNGPLHDGVPHTLNLSFPGLKADALLMNLDLAGVACSTGSACSSGSLLPSPVLLAMGVRRRCAAFGDALQPEFLVDRGRGNRSRPPDCRRRPTSATRAGVAGHTPCAVALTHHRLKSNLRRPNSKNL